MEDEISTIKSKKNIIDKNSWHLIQKKIFILETIDTCQI